MILLAVFLTKTEIIFVNEFLFIHDNKYSKKGIIEIGLSLVNFDESLDLHIGTTLGAFNSLGKIP